MQKLPGRIAALMIGTVLFCLLTVGTSIYWMSRALDQQALEQSLAQVRTARANLLNQIRLTTLDYAKWGTAVDAIETSDLEWVGENIGAAATVGQVVQLVVVWGGQIGPDQGWTDDDVTAGRVEMLDPGLLGLIENRVTRIPIGTYDAVDFFAWHHGKVFALNAARFEVVEDERSLSADDGDLARLTMGRRITDDVLAEVADSFLLNDLRIISDAPTDGPALPLVGIDGEPIGHLAWNAPRPGTALLERIWPLLALVLVATFGLASMGMGLARRMAQHLVAAERQASSAARSDAMTGLPNREVFNDALAAPARSGERAVLFLDVNDFKRINDSIGHEAGDKVIVGVAGRLARFVTRDCLLARIAGDEFVYIVSGEDAGLRAAWLAGEIERALCEPLSVMGRQMRITAAVGYAVQTEDAMPAESLVRQADLAMYVAKHQKGGPAVAFSSVIEQSSRDAAMIERGLRLALRGSGELSVVYQPIVTASGRLVRAEALARWTSPEIGSVSPDRFIAVAEQAGLMVELGLRLLQIICDDLVVYPDLKVSINISPLQLMAPDFISMITDELRARGIATSRVEVELTEAVLVDDPRLAAERLKELHAAGFSTALDDFGTGYSSVGYLAQLRFDTLKIDRSFVARIHSSQDEVEVVRGMIVMAHGLKLAVVCEGVEDAEELELLYALGCDMAQGFHIDRPLPIAALAQRWGVETRDRLAVA